MHSLRLYIFTIILMGLSNAHACLLEGLTLDDLQTRDDFTLLQVEDSLNLPEIFLRYPAQLGDFNPEECQGSVEKRIYRHQASRRMLLVLKTYKNICDGGNTSGIVFEGLETKPQRVLATIEDSFLICRQ